MIGRGAVGRPWLFAEVRAALEGRAWKPLENGVPADPFPEEAWDEVQADPKKASDKHKDAYGM